MVIKEKENKDEKLEQVLEQKKETTGTEAEKIKADEIEAKKKEQEDKEKLEQEAVEHKEKSELGRKVKAIEERMDSEMDSLHEKIDKLLTKDTKEIETEYDEDWIPQSRKEMDEYLEKKLEKRDSVLKDKDAKYNKNYTESVNKYRIEDDFDEICKELESNFNIRSSDNGEVDGRLNYLEASKAYYRKKLSKPVKENPLKGKKNDLPLGPGVEGEEIIEKEEPMPVLDDAAAEYVRKTGMSEEAVKKAMKKELPLGIQGIA